jgi:preprotein translocase subunit SecA
VIFDGLSAVLEEKKKRCDAIAAEHASIGYPPFAGLERDILLQILDAQWKDHLHTMDGLRDSVSLRGYASRDPKLEYQREGYALFEEMNQRIDTQAVDVIYKFSLPDPLPAMAARSTGGASAGADPARAAAESTPTPARTGGRGGRKPRPKSGKIGRNDPCSCGSGRKYKKCCGAL